MKVQKKHTFYFFIFFILIFIALYFKFHLYKTKDVCSNKEDVIEIKTFQINQGWGFDILINNKKYIHQTHIPAINGKKPFKTKDDAKKIAEIMKTKICKNILPPSVNLQEIDSLLTKN